MKALTAIAIQKSLLEIGQPIFDEVAKKLQKEFKCYIPDCYDHPEYLESILQSVFGNSHKVIVRSITEKLVDNLDDINIRVLVKTIGE